MVEEKELSVGQTDSTSCAERVKKRGRSVRGVHDVDTCCPNKIKVKFDPNEVSVSELQSTIKYAGHETLAEDMEEEDVLSLGNREFLFAAISGITLLSGILISYLYPDFVILQFYHDVVLPEPFYATAMIFGGYYVARKAVSALLRGTFVVDGLMIIGASGAVLIDAFAEGAAVLFLFSMAELLEDYSVERTRRSLNELVKLTPATVSVKRGDKYVDTRVDQIVVGDIILVKPGERIGADGVVVKGHSSVNQAPITGESMPVEKGAGDVVFSGTINQEGLLEIEVRKAAKDSTLARIIELVEAAEEQKAPTERFIDRFARYYTPTVVVLALLVATVPTALFDASFDVWFYKALLLLLISCPCALAISTPVSMVSAIASAARNGVLFKGGAYIEKLAKIDTFAFDKTGTLTEGRPKVTDVLPFNGHSRQEVLSIASALECNSQHPLAGAIVELAQQEGVSSACVGEYHAVAGKGVIAKIGEDTYIAGSRKLFDPEALSGLDEAFSRLEDEAKTIAVVGKETEVFGVIGISDNIRSESKRMVEKLHRMGVKSVVMITGDNARTARAVSSRIGADEYHAEVLPDQKAVIIKQMEESGRSVAMVGDGVNDAPALATATVGVAMGAAGSDTALEVADVALMNDDLSKVPYLLSLGKKTMSVVKENIVLAIGIKLLFAILVFPGLVTLWMAVAIGDMGVSLAVIGNALRLSRIR